MMNRTPAKTYYALLGVAPDASSEAIRRAWRAQVMRLHPDRASADRIRSEAQLRDINRAYTVLKNPDSRTAYDLALQPAARPLPTSPAPSAHLSTKPRAKNRTLSRWKNMLSLARAIFWPFTLAETRHGR